MKTTQFTLIVPVFNVENYLDHCLNSIINQSYQNFEVILVNDGSTDASGVICDSFSESDTRIKVIHQKNKGLSCARNVGIELAVGEYIWFIDSDDWIDKDALKILAKEIKEDEVEMIGFSSIRFFENENRFLTPYEVNEVPVLDGNKYIIQNQRFDPQACFYIYNRNFLNKNNFSFKEGLIHEDSYFNLVCFSKVHSVKKIAFALYYHRKRENSITSGEISKGRILSYLILIKLCLSLNKSNLTNEFYDKRIFVYISMMFLLLNYCNEISKKEKIKIIQESKQLLNRQNIYSKEALGIKVEKILYNLNAYVYFIYKKFKHTNKK